MNKTSVLEILDHLEDPIGIMFSCHVFLGSSCCDNFLDFHWFDDIVSCEEN